MKDEPFLVLASGSPRRRELLEHVGLSFLVRPADIDETRQPAEAPQELVERLARGKAHACAATLRSPASTALKPSGEDMASLSPTSEPSRRIIVLAADTIVWTDDGAVLGKPADEADARRTLQGLSGRIHHVSTGVCLLELPAPEGAASASSSPLAERSFVETTDVTFCELTPSQIAAYVRSREPMDKAGSYGIQGLGVMLVKSIRGDYDNVVGLPVSRVVRELAELWDASATSGSSMALVETLLSGGKHDPGADH